MARFDYAPQDRIRMAVQRLASERGRLTTRHVHRAVAETFELSLEDLMRRTREPKYAHPRQIAMAISHRMLGKSLVEIGRRMGRHHTTVMHACSKWDGVIGEIMGEDK